MLPNPVVMWINDIPIKSENLDVGGFINEYLLV